MKINLKETSFQIQIKSQPMGAGQSLPDFNTNVERQYPNLVVSQLLPKYILLQVKCQTLSGNRA